jgi:hypothetical protein
LKEILLENEEDIGPEYQEKVKNKTSNQATTNADDSNYNNEQEEDEELEDFFWYWMQNQLPRNQELPKKWPPLRKKHNSCLPRKKKDQPKIQQHQRRRPQKFLAAVIPFTYPDSDVILICFNLDGDTNMDFIEDTAKIGTSEDAGKTVCILKDPKRKMGCTSIAYWGHQGKSTQSEHPLSSYASLP